MPLANDRDPSGVKLRDLSLTPSRCRRHASCFGPGGATVPELRGGVRRPWISAPEYHPGARCPWLGTTGTPPGSSRGISRSPGRHRQLVSAPEGPRFRSRGKMPLANDRDPSGVKPRDLSRSPRRHASCSPAPEGPRFLARGGICRPWSPSDRPTFSRVQSQRWRSSNSGHASSETPRTPPETWWSGDALPAHAMYALTLLM